MYNVNYALETKIKAANTDAALKDAILSIASSVVTDMQNIDKRRETPTVSWPVTFKVCNSSC